MTPYQIHTFNNGIRLIHKYTPAYVAHFGIIINTGSRDETAKQSGLAHFIEHTIFKGTTNRKAFHILNYLESVGGELNAFTSKEDTFIYSAFVHKHYSRAIDIICDIVFNSVFPEKEIEKEKDIVIDEINSYKDNPSDLIFDEFENLVFDGHPLGRNILGSPELIRKFTRDDILQFIKKNYVSEEMVFCSVGNIDFAKLVKILEKYIEAVPRQKKRKTKKIPIKYKPVQITNELDIHQTHCVIGTQAYNNFDEKRAPLILLNNILGGPGMNSMLNLAIREKYGFCYSIESNFTHYNDTGIFYIYFGTDNSFLEKTLMLVHKQMQQLRDRKISNLQLHRAKQQLIGQMAIMQDSNSTELLAIGKTYVVYNKIDTIEDINKRIEAITAEELFEVANEVLKPSTYSMLTYVGTKN